MDKYPRTISVIFGFVCLAGIISFLSAVPWLQQQTWFLPALLVTLFLLMMLLIGGVFYEEMQQNKKDSDQEDKK